MKLTVKGDHGLLITATNPDERLRKDFADRIAASFADEIQGFLEEVSVALRNLKPGESKTVASKPIIISLESPAEEPLRTEEK